MKHEDHVALIRGGVEGAGPRWLELGSGDGEFTLALAEVLGDGAEIVAVDLDKWALADLAARLEAQFPGAVVSTRAEDFTRGLPPGPFDGVLAANSLHFVPDLAPFLESLHDALAEGGRLVVVEYDAEHGNPYVPHPVPLTRWQALTAAAGFTEPRLLHRVPSRFLGSIYGAASTRGATPTRGAAATGGTGSAPGAVLHSGPHGDDREE